jgi:hypothetical protein
MVIFSFCSVHLHVAWGGERKMILMALICLPGQQVGVPNKIHDYCYYFTILNLSACAKFTNMPLVWKAETIMLVSIDGRGRPQAPRTCS